MTPPETTKALCCWLLYKLGKPFKVNQPAMNCIVTEMSTHRYKFNPTRNQMRILSVPNTDSVLITRISIHRATQQPQK